MNIKNNCQLIGHLGSDPEVKNLDGGKKVANFSIATSESWKNENGEKQEQTQWHSLCAWNGLAGTIEKYLKKGSHIAVNGKITYQNYEGKDGVKRKSTIIVVNDFLMLDKKEAQ